MEPCINRDFFAVQPFKVLSLRFAYRGGRSLVKSYTEGGSTATQADSCQRVASRRGTSCAVGTSMRQSKNYLTSNANLRIVRPIFHGFSPVPFGICFSTESRVALTHGELFPFRGWLRERRQAVDRSAAPPFRTAGHRASCGPEAKSRQCTP